MPKPGVIIYFDSTPAVDKLSDEQAGALFKAILLYARDGILPCFTDPRLDIMWCFMQSAIDRDSIRYDDCVKSSRYSTFCRECKKHGIDPGSHEDWMSLTDEEISLRFDRLKSGI